MASPSPRTIECAAVTLYLAVPSSSGVETPPTSSSTISTSTGTAVPSSYTQEPAENGQSVTEFTHQTLSQLDYPSKTISTLSATSPPTPIRQPPLLDSVHSPSSSSITSLPT